jgi:hypothetical protein
MTRPSDTSEARPPLDPFDGTPLTRPPPVGIVHIAAAAAAAVLLCLGLAGIVVAVTIGPAAFTLTPDPAFVGPLDTSLPVDCVHVALGVLGLAASRSVRWSHLFLGAAGPAYMVFAFVELFAMGGEPGGGLVIHGEVAARGVQLPDVAPLVHFGLGAGMMLVRAVALTWPATGRRPSAG